MTIRYYCQWAEHPIAVTGSSSLNSIVSYQLCLLVDQELQLETLAGGSYTMLLYIGPLCPFIIKHQMFL